VKSWSSISTNLHSSLFSIDFDVADEIAYDFNLFSIGVVDLYAREFVFDQNRQLETIEPVGAKILTEMRFIYHAYDIDTQIVGNESAYFAGIKFFWRPRSWGRAQADEGHS